MIIFISDKKMSEKDKDGSHPKRSLSNIFEVQLWRKRRNFFLFLRFNFNGTSFAFDNILLNSFIEDDTAITVKGSRTSARPLRKPHSAETSSQFYFELTGLIG